MTDEPATTRRPGDRTALDRLLAGPEMAWLVDRVRGRILTAAGRPLHGVVQLTAPTDAQRAAAVRLVGRPRRGGAALRVDLAVVEEILRRGPWPAGLADAVETLSGPVVDQAARRAQDVAAWTAARDALEPAVRRFDGLMGWWIGWCASGGLKRAASAEAARTGATPSPEVGAGLVRNLAAVLDRLPTSGRPLAVLARTAVGDAHALDATRPLGRLAAGVVREAFRPGAGAIAPRETWAAAGVVMSNVASMAVCLGVPGASEGDRAARATSAALEAMRAARMPLVLTLDQVRSGGVAVLPSEAVVHVCENPSVLEVVAERWARSLSADAALDGDGDGDVDHDRAGPVLVCGYGQASTAVVELLQRLTAAGAQLRYHGDFDWDGLRIARALATHVRWQPWRYGAADYLATLADGEHSLRLTGSMASSPWDPALASAMSEHGIAVEEELVADLLADDVVRTVPQQTPPARTANDGPTTIATTPASPMR